MRASTLVALTAATMIVGLPIGAVNATCSPYFGCTGGTGDTGGTSYSGAPGPIAGAGIPALAIVAGGAYFMVRRLRRNKR